MSSTRACGSIANLNVCGDPLDALLGGVLVEEHASRVSARSPSTMFSATVITGISMKCWWTIPIPRSIASLGELIATGFPLIADLALVGLVEAVEDVHQRRLAGAVLAEQGVHLAAA